MGVTNQLDPACTGAKHCIDPYLHDEENVKSVMKKLSHIFSDGFPWKTTIYRGFPLLCF